MRLNTFKNYIGLCACKGCFKRIGCKVEVEAEKDGVKKIINRFWVCQDCAFDIAREVVVKEEY